MILIVLYRLSLMLCVIMADTPARLSHVTLVVKLWNSFKPNLTSDSTVHIPAVSFMWCTLQYCFLVIKRVGH